MCKHIHRQISCHPSWVRSNWKWGLFFLFIFFFSSLAKLKECLKHFIHLPFRFIQILKPFYWSNILRFAFLTVIGSHFQHQFFSWGNSNTFFLFGINHSSFFICYHSALSSPPFSIRMLRYSTRNSRNVKTFKQWYFKQ